MDNLPVHKGDDVEAATLSHGLLNRLLSDRAGDRQVKAHLRKSLERSIDAVCSRIELIDLFKLHECANFFKLRLTSRPRSTQCPPRWRAWQVLAVRYGSQATAGLDEIGAKVGDALARRGIHASISEQPVARCRRLMVAFLHPGRRCAFSPRARSRAARHSRTVEPISRDLPVAQPPRSLRIGCIRPFAVQCRRSSAQREPGRSCEKAGIA